MFFVQHIFHLSGQPGKNIIVRHRIVVTMLLLIHECDVDERHERNHMIILPALISLGVGIIAVGDELGCQAIELFVLTVDDDIYLFVVDVQPDM